MCYVWEHEMVGVEVEMFEVLKSLISPSEIWVVPPSRIIGLRVEIAYLV